MLQPAVETMTRQAVETELKDWNRTVVPAERTIYELRRINALMAALDEMDAHNDLEVQK